MSDQVQCCVCEDLIDSGNWKRVGSAQKFVCVPCIENRLRVIEEPGQVAYCEQCERGFRLPNDAAYPEPSICPGCVVGAFKAFAVQWRLREQANLDAFNENAAAAVKAKAEIAEAQVRIAEIAQDHADAVKWREYAASPN